MEDSSTPAELRRARRVATLLDDAVTVPGTNISVGLDPIIGLAPVSGDLVAGALSLYIVAEAVRYGVPRSVVAQMLFNVAVDVVVGSVPLTGDAFDFLWKPNRRNIALFERAVERKHLLPV